MYMTTVGVGTTHGSGMEVLVGVGTTGVGVGTTLGDGTAGDGVGTTSPGAGVGMQVLVGDGTTGAGVVTMAAIGILPTMPVITEETMPSIEPDVGIRITVWPVIPLGDDQT